MTSNPTIVVVDPLIGANVGEYTIIEAIGEGGMGLVYRGVQPVIKKRVAIKVLKPMAAGDDQQVKRLIAEAEAVNAIRHRGIIDIFSLGQLPDGRPYIVMEFLDGEPLDVFLRRSPKFTVLQTLELLVEICGPLDAAHQAGVVHRDLKPSNVFLCSQADGTRYVKLLDFGLAKRVEGHTGTSEQTSQTIVTGTPDYMAPEQARGQAVSARTDLYAVGVMAWQFLAGMVPFRGESPMDVMVAHVSAPVPQLPDSVPPMVVALVYRMMAKLPDERPSNVAEVRRELEGLIEDLKANRLTNSQAPSISPPAPSAPRAPVDDSFAVRPSRSPALALAVTVLAVAVGTVWFVSTREQPLVVEPVPVVPGQVDAGAVEKARESVDAAVVELEPLPVIDAGRPVLVEPKALPVVPVVNAPSAKVLLERIERLEKRAKESANFDPSSMPFLQSMRRRLKADESPATRRRLVGELDRWERQYLYAQ